MSYCVVSAFRMVKLPRITGREMVRFLEGEGFTLLRIRGSHHFLANDVRRTSVPVHGNRELKIGTLRGILRDTQMSPSEFASRYKP